MTAPNAKDHTGSVIALHCSLGSRHQWARLADDLGPSCRFIAPDLSGYGDAKPVDMPMTLEDEVDRLGAAIESAGEPFHLVGHSYGAAVAFKIASMPRYAMRLRSLTLIEPVLPTLLKESSADRRLHDLFAQLAGKVYADLWHGMYLEAVDRFTAYWNGSGPAGQLSAEARLRMMERIEKVAYDFNAVLSEDDVTFAAAAIGVPTLLISGGLSPYLTQRIAGRLASLIEGSEAHHFPAAGHMLPLTHARLVNPLISAHIMRANDIATVSLASANEVNNLIATHS
jgi:pimeloyl-ACP methyl ester carboxylesterase